MNKGYHEEGSSMIHQIPRLTFDDIADLGRWQFAQFRDEKTSADAFDRYHAYLERQRIKNERAKNK